MEWVINFEKKLEDEEISKLEDWKKRAIYRVSTCTKNLNPRAYLPDAVSFGPYHCDEVELKLQMDVHKRRALHYFLKKSRKPLTTYVNALQEVLPVLMASYDSLDIGWQQDNKFMQLMLLDGCFMLEILRAYVAIQKPGVVYGDYSGVAEPIFSYHGKVYVMPYIKRDMLMLQNQLPMLLLRKLVTVEATIAEAEDPVKYLNRLILSFVNPNYKYESDDQLQVDSLHVLDLYRKSLLGLGRSQPQMVPETLSKGIPKIVRSACFCIKKKEAGPVDIVRSAMKLHESGVDFKANDSTSIMDISFHGGKLKLPVIIVDDTTESAFLNLMAFERVHVGAGNEVTSYVSFMDNMIDSAKDVSLLHSSGILHNNIGSEKAVANLFNGISKDVTPDPLGSLEKVHNELDDYCNIKWKEWCANLKRTYFKSPWASLSLLAAIFIILLTTAQTFYAILGYHHPP
ncbi:hypothetical protein FRX31_007364 [Thalictrum thalictroides]|uniref:Uncharacterized protein n=1 Tax=Thalictrum thalictroides TaxID=46969 RepID=A0A7J6WZZ9_THATH|nr:hypothetical protein FRX31_007364 [Thalictrum thalictroides]